MLNVFCNKYHIYLVIFIAITSIFFVEANELSKSSFTIGLVLDGNGSMNESEVAIIKAEIDSLLKDQFEIHYLESNTFVGDWTIQSVKKALKLALEDPRVDIVITVGVLSTQLAKEFVPLSKPVFGTLVINYIMQDYPFVDDSSGEHHLNYVTLPPTMGADYEIFKKMIPHDNVAYLVDDFMIEAMPEVFAQAKELGHTIGAEIEIVPASRSAAETLNRIPKKAEAVYIVSLTGMSKDERKKFFDGLILLDLPSYSYFGKNDVELGALASMTPELDFSRMARRLALNIQRYLLGEELSKLPVLINVTKQLTLNQETIWGLNLVLPWEYLQDADILGASEERPINQINLTYAVLEGLQQNVNLAAAKQEVYIGIQDVKRAYSYLFPQIDISSLARAIDKPDAYVSAGYIPQRAIFGKASVSQIIYSNERFGQVLVEKWLQRARCDRYLTEKLDLIYEIASTYLNILRLSKIEDIQRNNLRITRTNLKVAQQRVDVGQARNSEVYRWESEIAKKRANLIISHFDVAKGKVLLNKLLNRPIGGPINIQDLNQNIGDFVLTPQWFEDHITSDDELNKLMNYSIMQGFANSPELKEINDQIEAQAVVLGITRRAFYAPEVSFIGEFGNRWWEDGAGTSGVSHTGGNQWLMGINIKFPLYTGGRKSANNQQAFEKLKQLIYIRENIVQTIDEKIRNYYLDASAADGVLRNARLAGIAAENNMDQIYQAYTKGKTSIIDLLDAQNQVLIAELDQTNAIYDYLVDIIGVQRETGKYDFLLSSDEKMNWKNCLLNILDFKVYK